MTESQLCSVRPESLGAGRKINVVALKIAAALLLLISVPADSHETAGRSGCIDVVAEGADNGGRDDSTKTIQRALNRLEDGGCLAFDPGIYKISDKLSVPDVPNWTILGRGRPTILQSRSNTGIFYINGYHGGVGFRIDGLRLSWATLQRDNERNSVAIGLGRAPGRDEGGAYGFTITNISIEKGFRGIAVAEGEIEELAKFPIWGYSIENVSAYELSGAAIKLYSPGPAGSPRVLLSNIYIQSGRAKEPSINIGKSTSVKLQNIEFNLGTGTQLLIQGNGQVSIENLRAETVSASDGPLFYFEGAGQQVDIRNIEVQTFAVGRSIAAVVLVCASGSVEVSNILTRDIRADQGSVIVLKPIGAGSIVFNGNWSRQYDSVSKLTDSAGWTKLKLPHAVFLTGKIVANTDNPLELVVPRRGRLLYALCIGPSESGADHKVDLAVAGTAISAHIPCRVAKEPEAVEDFWNGEKPQIDTGGHIEIRAVSGAAGNWRADVIVAISPE